MTTPNASAAQGGSIALPDPPTLHHVGFVVAAIPQVGEQFAVTVGAEWDGKIIHDPLQSAKVAFLRWRAPKSSALELIEPSGPETPLHKFLAKGGGLHHICYEVDSLEEQLKQSRSSGCLIAKAPLPAVAFDGRRIAWVYTPQRLLIEYLERFPTSATSTP